MATKHSCIQGSSFAYDFTCDDITTFDTGWTGQWAIVKSLDDVSDGNDITPLASGSLTKSDDSTAMQLRITPTDTSSIPVGYYYLVVQVSNTSINFSDEIMQDQFEIKKQGIA